MSSVHGMGCQSHRWAGRLNPWRQRLAHGEAFPAEESATTQNRNSLTSERREVNSP